MRVFILFLILLMILPVNISCSDSGHTKSLPIATAIILNDKLSMPTILEIVKKGQTPKYLKNYLNEKRDQYKLVGSQWQGEMEVEGYSVLDTTSPIIGYSLFFHKDSGNLVIVDASVNPLSSNAMKAVSQLIIRSLDSVDAGEKSKLYFLGIYDIENQQALKIMVLETQKSNNKEYAIRYSLSQKQ